MIDWTRGMVPQGNCDMSVLMMRTLAVTTLMPEMCEGYAVTVTAEIHADPPINLHEWCPYMVLKYFFDRSVRWGKHRLFMGNCAWVSKSEVSPCPSDPVWLTAEETTRKRKRS